MYPDYSRGWAPLRGFIRGKRKFIDSPIPELYDLDKDFDELNNVASGKAAAGLKAELAAIVSSLTPARKISAAQQADRETRERLASLGYVSTARLPPKKDFGVRDDVKVLLPFINRVGEAWKLYRQGKQTEGIKLLESIIEERKDIDMAYKQLATIHQERGREDTAIAILESGLEALPSSYELYMEYMKTLLSAGQHEKIIDFFQRTSLREAEVDPEIWNNLGTAYAKTGNFEEAIKAFEMGLSLDEKHPELYNNIANACYSQGLQRRDESLYARCFEYYKKAIELDPQYPAPYYGLGHAYRQQGNMEGAVYCWEKAVEADPGFSQAYIDLALAYLNTGDKTKAVVLLGEFKRRFYERLSPADKERLDLLIEQSRK